MPCPFCGGPVDDENCTKCGSLEGFTTADTASVVQKPSKMISMSAQWTERYVMDESEQLASGSGGGGGAAAAAAAARAGGSAKGEGAAHCAEDEDDEVDDDDVEVFENSCVDNALSVVEVDVNGHTYSISQEMEPDDLAPIFSDVWTGSQVWRCSIVSSKFMSDLYAGRVGSVVPPGRAISAGGGAGEDAGTVGGGVDGVDPAVMANVRCIELGSGCGLLPIHAARLGVSCVVATDQTPMVRLARFNIAKNLTGAARAACVAEDLFWGDEAQAAKLLKQYGPFDVVWVSDCLNPIYGVDSYEQLAKSVRDLAGPNTLCLVAYEDRGNTAADVDPLVLFFGHLNARDQVTVLEDDESPISIYACHVGAADAATGAAPGAAPGAAAVDTPGAGTAPSAGEATAQTSAAATAVTTTAAPAPGGLDGRRQQPLPSAGLLDGLDSDVSFSDDDDDDGAATADLRK